eukprot:6399900-Amphidinium_carterae.1
MVRFKVLRSCHPKTVLEDCRTWRAQALETQNDEKRLQIVQHQRQQHQPKGFAIRLPKPSKYALRVQLRP